MLELGAMGYILIGLMERRKSRSSCDRCCGGSTGGLVLGAEGDGLRQHAWLVRRWRRISAASEFGSLNVSNAAVALCRRRIG
jgi:tRNA G18 (ribose-2'-O)-methylase SpoU